jgi:hypothetical protein
MPIRYHGPLASSWWGATAPPTTVALGAVTWIGTTFQVTTALRMCGFRTYSPAFRSGDRFGLLWDTAGPTILRLTAWKDGSAGSSNLWEQTWLQRWAHLATGHTYALAVRSDADYFRHTAQLTSPVTIGSVKFIAGFQTTVIDPLTVTLTTNTNANGVDLLYYAP